jgi:hypothetical protein
MYFHSNLEALELIPQDTVLMKVDLPTIKCRKKPIASVRKECTDESSGHFLMVLYVSTRLPYLILKMASGCVEGISDSHVKIRVSFSRHHKIFFRHGQVNVYFVKNALVMMPMRSLNDNPLCAPTTRLTSKGHAKGIEHRALGALSQMCFLTLFEVQMINS